MVGRRTIEGDRRVPTKGDLARARIIEAAAHLLESVSIGELSMGMLAKEAGVTRQGLYFYFESKYAVVAAALDEAWVEFESARVEAQYVARNDVPALVIEHLLVNASAIWRRHRAVLIACAQGRAVDAQLARMWEQFLRGTSAPLSALLTKWREAGRIEPVAEDIESLVDSLLGMTVWSLLDNSRDLPELSRSLETVSAIWAASIWGPLK